MPSTYSQVVLWTALPNGLVKSGDAEKIALSAFLSPRLMTTTGFSTLVNYPDFVRTGGNWADTVAGLSFVIETARSSAPSVVTPINASSVRVTSTPDPTLWNKLFATTTMTKSWEFADHSGQQVESHSVGLAIKAIMEEYRKIAGDPSAVYRVPTAAETLGRAKPGSALVSAMDASVRPKGTEHLVSASAVNVFEEFNRFHAPFPDRGLRKAAGFEFPPETYYDFHTLVAALSSFPALIRRFGFVVDFEIDAAAWAQVSSADRVRVRPVWNTGTVVDGVRTITSPGGEALTHTDASPWTQYTASGLGASRRFQMASRNARVVDGCLVMRHATDEHQDPVTILDVDPDSTIARFIEQANNIARSVNQDKRSAKGAEVSASATTTNGALPPLGLHTLCVALNDNKGHFKLSVEEQTRKNEALMSGRGNTVVNYAEDVTRGFRIDAWDNITKHWHPLCGRTGEYKVGGVLKTRVEWPGGVSSLTDEGWVELATIQAPDVDPREDDTGSLLKLHETLFNWTGWSLAVARPGKALLDSEAGPITGDKYVGPGGVEQPLGAYPRLPLDAQFNVVPGTLPRLRFGQNYRFRARLVDLAGNSIAFAKSDPPSALVTTRAVTHKRYDPIKPPIVVTSAPLSLGESTMHMVIRSNYNTAPAEKSKRHVMSPRAGVTLAEAHGMFDKPKAAGAKLDGSAATFEKIAAFDDYDLPTNATGDPLPLDPRPATIPYLPDPAAYGVAFLNLPGVPTATSVKRISGTCYRSGAIIPVDGKVASISSTRVPFKTSTKTPWYAHKPLSLQIMGVEATDPRLAKTGQAKIPRWSESTRLLVVDVPKAESVEVGVSCFVSSKTLEGLGIYQWATVAAAASASSQMRLTRMTPVAKVPVHSRETTSSIASLLLAMSRIGVNWTITPAEKLTVTHAVQQPLIAPELTSSAVVERVAGESFGTLIDWVPVSGKSTAEIRVDGTWPEYVDDPSAGPPQWGANAANGSSHAFSVLLSEKDTFALNASRPRPAGLSAPAGYQTPLVTAVQQRHEFGDTKHRHVEYTITGASRFAQYFPDGTLTTRAGDPRKIHVLSTALPGPPEIALVIPAFEWTRTATTSKRTGGKLRVFLKRPWFGTGANERLAIVVAPAGSTATALLPFVSQWGADPIFASTGRIPAATISLDRLTGSSEVARGLHLPEHAANTVDIAAYEVDYDSELGLWYADVAIDPADSYFPFVKLAFARYQPYSVAGVALSSAVVVDLVQLTPERTASATKSGTLVSISVNGPTYIGGASGKVRAATTTASLEQRPADEGDLAWTPVGTETTLGARTDGAHTTWSGSLSVSAATSGNDLRVLIREYEQWSVDDPNTIQSRRLVFADSIAVR